MAALVKPKVPIQSTAGAVPVKNEKGEISMEKVKVSRYVSGKRPEYAPDTSDEEDDEHVEFSLTKQQGAGGEADGDYSKSDVVEREDRRLRRLQTRHHEDVDSDDDREARVMRHRQMLEPEVLATGDDDVEMRRRDESSSDEEEEELDDEEIERRRELLRQKVRVVKKEEEVLGVEEEKESGDESGQDADDSSEYEEYSGSEEEDTGPRLKPVFVRKKDRITIQEKEKELQKLKDSEAEAKRLATERRQQTLKLVDQEIRRELEQERQTKAEDCDAIKSDAENDEEEYEAWKVRELKRIKRDRDERENIEREKAELERVHHMTEEERRQEQKLNPKVVTNKAAKGKYKFLQKYYHRGAFFLDKDDEVLKRDFSAPTLEDHFEKTVLPKVMQVKNFGRSGRTKYTHLVDQDTTQFDAPWADNSALNIKFHANISAGMKQTFERPAVKKRK